MCVGGVYSEDESTHQHLNTVICEHLFRQGRLEIGEQIMKVGLNRGGGGRSHCQSGI